VKSGVRKKKTGVRSQNSIGLMFSCRQTMAEIEDENEEDWGTIASKEIRVDENQGRQDYTRREKSFHSMQNEIRVRL
jgi:hypothetical protein